MFVVTHNNSYIRLLEMCVSYIVSDSCTRFLEHEVVVGIALDWVVQGVTSSCSGWLFVHGNLASF